MRFKISGQMTDLIFIIVGHFLFVIQYVLNCFRDDLIDEIKLIKKDLNDQMEKLNRSTDYRKKTSNSARKKIGNVEIWSIHEVYFRLI